MAVAGVVVGVEVLEVVGTIHMIRRLLILGSPGPRLVARRRVGDLVSGVELWAVRQQATWQETEAGDNSRCHHKLEVSLGTVATAGGLVLQRLHQTQGRRLAQAHQRGTRVQGLDQHHGDRKFKINLG